MFCTRCTIDQKIDKGCGGRSTYLQQTKETLPPRNEYLSANYELHESRRMCPCMQQRIYHRPKNREGLRRLGRAWSESTSNLLTTQVPHWNREHPPPPPPPSRKTQSASRAPRLQTPCLSHITRAHDHALYSSLLDFFDCFQATQSSW